MKSLREKILKEKFFPAEFDGCPVKVRLFGANDWPPQEQIEASQGTPEEVNQKMSAFVATLLVDPETEEPMFSVDEFLNNKVNKRFTNRLLDFVIKINNGEDILKKK